MWPIVIIFAVLLKATEYSLIDFAAWLLSSLRTLQKIWPELMKVNLFGDAPEIDVPVYFKYAAHDIFYNQPVELVEMLTHIKEIYQNK